MDIQLKRRAGKFLAEERYLTVEIPDLKMCMGILLLMRVCRWVKKFRGRETEIKDKPRSDNPSHSAT